MIKGFIALTAVTSLAEMVHVGDSPQSDDEPTASPTTVQASVTALATQACSFTRSVSVLGMVVAKEIAPVERYAADTK
jgi:hypothetical protein